MPKTFISESEIETTDLQPFSEVLLAKTENDFSAVAVFTWPAMAPLCSALSEGVAVLKRQLIILVDDPDDRQVYERIQAKVLAKIGAP